VVVVAVESPGVGAAASDAGTGAWARQAAAAHSAFWRDWLTACRVNKLHAVGFIVERALACVLAGRYPDAAALTLPAPALRPLVVLMAWDQVCLLSVCLRSFHCAVLYLGGKAVLVLRPLRSSPALCQARFRVVLLA
jgi:hypothetical protein